MLVLWRLQLDLRQYGKKRQIYHPIQVMDWIELAHVQLRARLSVQSSYRYKNILQIGQALGHHMDAKISPKAASEKVQTTMSENRYTSLNIDVFWMPILTLIATTGDNARASFLIHQVPRTSATVWRYRRMFTHFYLRVWASKYTCRPMIANLL